VVQQNSEMSWRKWSI